MGAPDPLTGVYTQAGDRYHVDPLFMQAIGDVESGQNDQARSPAGASGRMQFMPQTAASYGVRDPTNPHQAIPGATAYMNDLLNQYKNPVMALMAYNGGNPSRWNNPETQQYVWKVAAAYQRRKAAQQQGPSQMPAQADTAAQAVAPASVDPAAQQWLQGVISGKSDPTAAPAATDPGAQQWLQSVLAPAAPTAPPPDATTPAQRIMARANSIPADTATISAGLHRGFRDVVDRPAAWLQHAVTGGTSVGDQNKADLAAYQTQYGDQPGAGLGRFIGQTAATAPLLGPLAEAASAGGNALARTFPAVAPVVDKVGTFLAGNAGGGPGLVNRLVGVGSTATNGLVTGGTLGALTSGQSDEPLGPQIMRGAEMGALGGAAGNLLARAGASGINALTGAGTSAIDAGKAALARMARDKYGIPINWTQMGDSPALQRAQGMLKVIPGSGVSGQQQNVQSAFTRAVSKTIGADTPQITPEVMAAQKDRLGGIFDAVAKNTVIKPDVQLATGLKGVADEASRVLPPDSFGLIAKQIKDVQNALAQNGGVIPGDVYMALTRKGAPLDRLASSNDPNLRYYAGELQDTLQGALQRNAAPDDLAALQTARMQWKNLRTIEPLVVKGAPGEISPLLLNQRVSQSFKDRAYKTGDKPDLINLADIGQAFLRHPSTSGTAENLSVMGAMKRLGATALGAGAGGAAGTMGPGALAGAAAGLGGTILGGRAAASALNSDLYTNLLINNALRGGNSPTANMLLQAAPYAAPITVLGRNAIASP